MSVSSEFWNEHFLMIIVKNRVQTETWLTRLATQEQFFQAYLNRWEDSPNARISFFEVVDLTEDVFDMLTFTTDLIVEG